MEQDFLFEIGTEELPASFVAKALAAMPELVTKLFADARLSHGAIRTLGTPRRLALYVDALATEQRDVSELVSGPSKSVAFDASGALTKAGEAFVKKLNATAADVQTVTTPKGEYIAVKREEKGQAARSVLPELLTKLCATIPFQKSMRWGAGDVAFGRPVHWLVALHGTTVIPTTFAAATAGRATKGHRFLAPGFVDVATPDAYVATLKSAHVFVDPKARLDAMHAALHKAAAEAGGTLIEDPFLMEECLSLVEEPHVVIGGFEETYLDLPDEVIVAVMRGHQRYFAVKNPATGRLLPKYLTVVNTANDPVTIRRGNDRVLRARLADARFFVDEDRKVSLSDRAMKLSGVVFQAKLGTVAEKVSRVGALADHLAGATEGAVNRASAREAASLSKADLVSYIVGEFPELQGIMGRYYALAEKLDPQISDAIRDHYLPKSASDAVPTAPLSAIVALADRFDTLVGCFGIGLVPTGSADPFALRRAALAIVRIALEGPLDVDVKTSLAHAHTLFVGKNLQPAADVVAKLDDFFRARLKAFFGERGAADVVDACLAAWNGSSVRDLEKRIKAVEAFRALAEFDSLATAFKRSYNISKDTAPGVIDASLLKDDAEKLLAERFGQLRSKVESSIASGDYEPALMMVAKDLKEPIDRFFETVFVMVDDEAVRTNRLRLLRAIADTLNSVAHFHLLGTAA